MSATRHADKLLDKEMYEMRFSLENILTLLQVSPGSERVAYKRRLYSTK